MWSYDNCVGDNFIFKQDKTSCHKAKSFTQFSNAIGVRFLNWAPQSSEKCFIENIWAYVKQKLSVDLARTGEKKISEVKEHCKRALQAYILTIGRLCTPTSAKSY